MDVDDLLSSTGLPEVVVDPEAALARTTQRGRSRRRLAVVTGGLSGLVIMGLVAAGLSLATRDDSADVSAGPSVGTEVAPEPEPGDTATWTIDPSAPPSAADSTFIAQVTRLGCNGGVTGRVLRPGVVVGESEVVVTFNVEADPDGGTCPINDRVPYRVDLGAPLGDRALVDGSCGPGAPAANFCETDGVRWRPELSTKDGAAAPRECEATNGAVTDVAHEPDWRQFADYEWWTDADGCLLRIDVLAERPGPEHCGWEAAQTIIAGQPLGARYTAPEDTTHFVRDPDGVYGRPELTAGFEPDATVPEGAIDSGYRKGGAELWHIPGDQAAIWLVSPNGVERWPAGETPNCS